MNWANIDESASSLTLEQLEEAIDKIRESSLKPREFVPIISKAMFDKAVALGIIDKTGKFI